ncbi:MAG TPA: TonB-dependent receptor, partial [Vicinamibacterales bacterium]|nr:TonB-dependent receptor [Vicinamibacterales bacterium]
VVDQTGGVVAGVVVTLRHQRSGELRQVRTAADGTFEADGLPPGDYEIAAAAAGFATTTARAALAPGERRRLRLVLRVGGLTEDVVVHATEVAGSHERLRRLPGSVEILDRETLETSRVFTTNEALRKLPGLHVRDEEGFGLRPNIGIRGINPTRSTKVLLLEDGIPLTYAPYGDNASYYHPPIDRFERVEVLKGGAQIAYGPQTVAGLVNYITPAPPPRTSATLAATGGNRDYFNGHAGVGSTIGATGFLLDYLRKQGDGARANTSSAVNDVNAKVVRRAGADQTWTFRGNYYSEDSNVTYSGLREDEFRADPRGNPFRNDFFYIDRYGASASHAWAASGDVAVTTNVYFSSFRRHWWRQSSNSAQRPNDAADPRCGGMANLDTTCGNEGRLRHYHAWGVEPRVRVHYTALGVRSEADAGVRFHAERQHRRQENGDTPRARSGALVEHNLRRNQAYSAFFQNRLLFGAWTITPGLRVEHIRYERTNRLAGDVTGRTRLTEVVPGFGVSYTRGEQATLFAGVHRGFAPPRTEDIISNQGGVVDLDPERGWNYEAGLRLTPRAGLRLDATLFRLDYENQIVPASLAGGIGATLTNAGATLHQGLELDARIDSAALAPAAHNVSLRAAITWLPVARFEGLRFSSVPGFGHVPIGGNRLPYAPEWLATIGIGYTHPAGLTLLVEAVHTSAQFGDDLNTVEPSPDGQRGLLPAYTVWNLAGDYRLGRATLFVAIKNLFDELFIVDRSRGILPGPPRLVHAGIRVRL